MLMFVVVCNNISLVPLPAVTAAAVLLLLIGYDM